MPICDGTNMSTLNTGAADTDPHGDGAKLKKSRDQAYFNSYDFDAIEELPSEEEEVVKLDSRHSIRRIDLNEATRNREITPVSDVYFKRLTSYFTTTKRIPDQIKVHESQSGSDANSFSSSDSSKAIYAEGIQEHVNITETPKNTINNFLLPRAILKSQSGITAKSMSVRSLSSIASSKTATSSIRSTRSINIKNVNVTICNGSNVSNDKINMKSIGDQVEIHKQMIGNSGNTKEDSGKVVTPTTAPDALDTNNSGFTMQCYGKNDRERVISQSHYSTEKSGSSGYYSSNLCSTSSIEDHIYSEPVIDVMHSRILPLTKTLPQGLVGKLHDNDSSVHRINMSCEANLKTIGNDDKLKTELRTLETSIENLDRHLKSYPKLLGHQLRPAMTYLPCGEGDCLSQTIIGGFQQRGRQQLPTIMEGIDNQSPPKTQNTWSDDMDDSLMDIDLDSFLLVNELNKVTEKTEPLSGIDNPNYRKRPQINDEALENNYKCSKYVNSCPEDAYKVESVIEGDDTENQEKPIAFYLKKYNDKIHFQNTKDMLEEIRSKIRDLVLTAGSSPEGDILPSELETNIATLKMELETYLRIMNRNSEMEIKQLCTGLVNNQKLVAMTKAFERRKSFDKNSDIEYDLTYEPVQNHNGNLDYAQMNSGIRSIRCSDPNFKMRRKSLNDIFPEISDGFESTASSSNTTFGSSSDDQPPNNQCVTAMYSSPVVHCNPPPMPSSTRLKRNLSFQRPTLNPDPHVKISTHPTEDDEDKNTFLEWHKNKPSIWEQYYGTNRINQTLVGKRGQLIKNQASMLSYPSSRPESDFTLDLPRAEQLRLKMEKEKKFRNRCRILTTFLSLVFFLLTVMVVSLVLTRGKRMFGSML